MREQLQLQFIELRQLKKERKDLRDMYKDALAQTDQYEEIVEKIKELREKKKQIEAHVQGQMGRAYEKIQDLDREIKTRKEMLNDAAVTTLMSGNTVEVKDEFENEYEPVFSTKFVLKATQS